MLAVVLVMDNRFETPQAISEGRLRLNPVVILWLATVGVATPVQIRPCQVGREDVSPPEDTQDQQFISLGVVSVDFGSEFSYTTCNYLGRN